jgi:DNA-binding NtrC family response regulator
MAGKLIFFVDDDKMILNLMEYTFKSRAGYDVKTFFSGEECIDNLDLKPDLIVLDHIFLQRGRASMSGMETLQKIHQVNSRVPVIILSSQEDRHLIPEFLKNGAKKYIAKDDYFIDSLIETIEEEITL